MPFLFFLMTGTPDLIRHPERREGSRARKRVPPPTPSGCREFPHLHCDAGAVRLVRDTRRRSVSASIIMKKAVPKFRTEDAEREFWASHDSTEYIDWRKARRARDGVNTLPNLKPSSQTISIRLPKPMLDRLKLLANKRDVPYQSLLKMFVADRLEAEFKSWPPPTAKTGIWHLPMALRLG